MSNTLMLAANVLGFQLVELWFDGEDGKKQCAFVYAAEDILQASPTIVTGYYPEYKKQHILSPKVIFVTIYTMYIFDFVIFLFRYANSLEYRLTSVTGKTSMNK